MTSPYLRPVRPELSFAERAARLREKMIAGALTRLEDWRTPPLPAPPDEVPPPRTICDGAPPVRWLRPAGRRSLAS